MQRVELRRNKSYADRFRAYKVMLNKQQVAEIKHGETIYFEIDKPQSELQLKIDWASSNKLILNKEIAIGKQVEPLVIESNSSLKGWRMILALYYISFGRKNYIRLTQVSNV